MSATRQLGALVRKDLRLELATRDTIAATILFAVTTLVVFEFAIGTREGALTRFAAGILWATLSFTAVLAVSRAWVAERQQGVLDATLVAPVPRLVLLASKAISLFCYLTAVELVAVPLAGIFFVSGGFAADLGLVALVCLLANLALALLGAVVASLATFTRARELVVPVLFLPLSLPVVVAASGATRAVLGVANDMAEYRGYVLLIAGHALVLGLVAYAICEALFDD